MKFPDKYAKWAAAFVFGAALIAVYKTFDNLTFIFSGVGKCISAFGQVIVGFAIAYILNIPIKRLEKRLGGIKNSHISRHSLGISITAVYILSFAALCVTLSTVIPQIMQSIRDLYYNHSVYVTKAIDFLNRFEVIKNSGIVNEEAIYDKIESFFGGIDIATVSYYATGVYNFTYGLLKTVIAVIISIYMLIDRERMTCGITRFLRMFVKRSSADLIIRETRRINDIFTSYIYSRLMCSLVMALISVPVLYILRVKYALVLGIFLGACDMIPYFGSIFGSILLVLINLLTGGDGWQTLWLAVVLIILQQVDGNLIAPKIISSRLELRPLTIMCTIIVGGNLFGVLGMVIAVPVVAVAKGIYSDIYKERKRKLSTRSYQSVSKIKVRDISDE